MLKSGKVELSNGKKAIMNIVISHFFYIFAVENRIDNDTLFNIDAYG